MLFLVVISLLALFCQFFFMNIAHAGLRDFLRELNMAIIISLLLSIILDGQLRRREQDHVLTAISKELSSLAEITVHKFEELKEETKDNALSLQNELIRAKLADTFGEEIFLEINTCLTSIPFLRESFELEFNFSDAPKIFDQSEFVKVTVTTRTTIRCVRLEKTDYSRYLPKYFVDPNPDEAQPNPVFHYCTINEQPYNLAYGLTDASAKVLESNEGLYFAPNETRRVEYEYSFVRRQTDNETFYTFLPSKSLRVVVRPRNDQCSIVLDPIHRRDVRVAPVKREDGALVLNFPVPLIPFQGFELRWSDA